jgi:hypothetical protein
MRAGFIGSSRTKRFFITPLISTIAWKAAHFVSWKHQESYETTHLEEPMKTAVILDSELNSTHPMEAVIIGAVFSFFELAPPKKRSSC